MKISTLINLTQAEEETLNIFIELLISPGTDNSLFISSEDRNFLDKHKLIIQENFEKIIEWFPVGCGKIKFKFTELGLGLIKAYRSEVIEELRPILLTRIPSIDTNRLPKVRFKVMKEKTTA